MNISHTCKFHSYEKMPPMNISPLRQSPTYDNLLRMKISHVGTSLIFVYLTHVNISWRTIWHLWNFHTYRFNLIYIWQFHTFEYLTQLIMSNMKMSNMKMSLVRKCHKHFDFAHIDVSHIWISHTYEYLTLLTISCLWKFDKFDNLIWISHTWSCSCHSKFKYTDSTTLQATISRPRGLKLVCFPWRLRQEISRWIRITVKFAILTMTTWYKQLCSFVYIHLYIYCHLCIFVHDIYRCI